MRWDRRWGEWNLHSDAQFWDFYVKYFFKIFLKFSAFFYTIEQIKVILLEFVFSKGMMCMSVSPGKWNKLTIAIDCVDGGDIVNIQFKVEDVEIFANTLLID